MKTLIVLIFILICGCQNPTLDQYNANNYKELKSQFQPQFINQFPKHINSKIAFTDCSTDIEKNKVGLILYEYIVSSRELDSIKNFTASKALIAKYNSFDSCLLIVNRFETKYTSENGIVPTIQDSTQLKRNCYNKMVPVPKFIDYDGGGAVTTCGLDSTFTIYVLEAKPGIYFEKYQKKPFVQMPEKWANGYSKGIAISRKDKTVIYWSIMW
ncbi:MAG TPA: hypothetical protein VFL76_00905 [Edaphocola sp.]|nr:hypothetical protein [Edaphocola sp.]